MAFRNVLAPLLLVVVILLFIVMKQYLYEVNQEADVLQDLSHIAKKLDQDIKNIPKVPLKNNQGNIKKLSPVEELERIWNYAYKMQYKCTKSKYLGGRPDMFMDGAYDLCIEPQFWEKANNPDYKCLMYSFGVGWDFSFDDEMAKLGCEVHSFDPSMNIQDGMVRDSGVTFHKIGIFDKDIEADSNGWKMRTLKTLLKELGHNGRYLDYLKVDTDAPQGGFEDTLMQELIDTGLHQCVRQFAQEIHLMGPLQQEPKLNRCHRIYTQMNKLNDHGWQLYNTTDNVRSIWLKHPGYTQLNNKRGIITGGSAILWETAFVNTEVKGPCVVG
ncbi:putative methyltransferase-like protein 24 [Ciona intestinalis]